MSTSACETDPSNPKYFSATRPAATITCAHSVDAHSVDAHLVDIHSVDAHSVDAQSVVAHSVDAHSVDVHSGNVHSVCAEVAEATYDGEDAALLCSSHTASEDFVLLAAHLGQR